MQTLPPHQHALLTALHLSHGENHLDEVARTLVELGWAKFEQGTLSLTGEAAEEEPESSDPEHALTAVHVAGGTLHVTPATDPRVHQGAAFLKQRKELLVQKERTRRRLVL